MMAPCFDDMASVYIPFDIKIGFLFLVEQVAQTRENAPSIEKLCLSLFFFWGGVGSPYVLLYAPSVCVVNKRKTVEANPSASDKL